MIADLFWNIATSKLALGLDGLILLAALVVGFIPFGKFLPVIGPYVPVARLVALLVALSMSLLLGFRIADERATAKNLRATIAAQAADLENARKSAADETARATQIEASANAQHESDAQYIASLAARPACALDDDDLGNVGRLRVPPAGASHARSAAGAK